MTISDATVALLADGIWARSPTAVISTPEELGIDRAVGWSEGYEQQGSGKRPEAALFNRRFHELDSAIFDIVRQGVLSWDARVNYAPSPGNWVFVSHAGELWRTNVANGPAYGNAQAPADAEGNIWRLY